jgi:hypothetical protein
VRDSPICPIPNRLNDSPLWNDLMKVRHIYPRGRGYEVNNGKSVRFWQDVWLEEKPLCIIYPVLFELCLKSNCSVADVAANEWVVEFKIILQRILRDQWYQLAAKLNLVSLNGEKDCAVWKWTASKKFTVKSVYEFLSREESGASYKRVWQAKILEKIKIFMWFVEQKTILAKDVMLKRNWQGDPRCYFYGLPESCDHLPIAKVIWGLIAICLQQNTRPSTYEQFWVWIKGVLPRGGKSVYAGPSSCNTPIVK